MPPSAFLLSRRRVCRYWPAYRRGCQTPIADKLGYKNGHSVATIVYEIAKQLRVEGVFSRTEKRQFTADAYRQAKRNVSKSLSLDVGRLEDDRYHPYQRSVRQQT